MSTREKMVEAMEAVMAQHDDQEVPEGLGEKDWCRACANCGELPTVKGGIGLCGPCTFGEAETAGGNW